MRGNREGFSLQPGGSGGAKRRCAVLAGESGVFAGGEAVGGGGVTVPVEILEKMPKGRGESGRGIRGNAEFLKKRYFFIKGIPSGRDFGV